jgi:hypothetical protein
VLAVCGLLGLKHPCAGDEQCGNHNCDSSANVEGNSTAKDDSRRVASVRVSATRTMTVRYYTLPALVFVSLYSFLPHKVRENFGDGRKPLQGFVLVS